MSRHQPIGEQPVACLNHVSMNTILHRTFGTALVAGLSLLAPASALAFPFSAPTLVWSGEPVDDSIYIGDVNGDALPDVALHSSYATLNWFVNTGGGNFAGSHVISVANYRIDFAQVADLDQDGDADAVAKLIDKETAAILVEPIQARGGCNIPPMEFLPLLRQLCDEHGALLILDEIYTGFGRTGKWFACEHSGVLPDLICLGKALTGGFPLSACVGRADLMDAAWPASTGEAIHTSTFLGHPVGCAMALAQIEEILRLKLCGRSAILGKQLLAGLSKIHGPKSKITYSRRGVGLMAGLELRHPDGSPAGTESIAAIKAMLQRGFILLPEGEHGNVISFTPPLTITGGQLKRMVKALAEVLP